MVSDIDAPRAHAPGDDSVRTSSIVVYSGQTSVTERKNALAASAYVASVSFPARKTRGAASRRGTRLVHGFWWVRGEDTRPRRRETARRHSANRQGERGCAEASETAGGRPSARLGA